MPFGGLGNYSSDPYHNPTRREEEGGKPRPMWVQGLLAASAVLIAGLVLAGSLQLLYVNRQGSAPQQRVEEFCQALVAKDYSTAWEYVSTAKSSSDFVQANLARDAQIGPVRSCVVLGRNYFASFSLSDAGFDVAVTLSNGHHQGVIMLHDDGDAAWTIYGISSDLSLRL